LNGAVFASQEMIDAVLQLKQEEKLVDRELLIAANTGNKVLDFSSLKDEIASFHSVSFSGKATSLKNVWDIFSLNEQAIKEDFATITAGRKSTPIPDGVVATGKENIFLEEGAIINAGCILNATTGPIYLGKNAELLEGCMLRGSVAICEHAALKMGAKVYSGTTIGPSCKVGGEVSNVVFFANSNKGHDGFLGNAVIGEWCNIGADTNCSNLKNNYDQVKIWDEYTNKPIRTGLQFCGLIMGDHSKCGINTMFNTGTVVGVSANIYGGDFQEKFIPSFFWGGPKESETYNLKKALDTAQRMMARRNKTLSEEEVMMYQHIFEATAEQRNFWIKNK
jgi:UDP-N-acetylglucosamine diphosphorylase/glucosamine-1-phosphate N-acetyltransferase